MKPIPVFFAPIWDRVSKSFLPTAFAAAVGKRDVFHETFAWVKKEVLLNGDETITSSISASRDAREGDIFFSPGFTDKRAGFIVPRKSEESEILFVLFPRIKPKVNKSEISFICVLPFFG